MNGFSYTPVFTKPLEPRQIPANIAARVARSGRALKDEFDPEAVLTITIPKKLLPLVAALFTFRSCTADAVTDDQVQRKLKATPEQIKEANNILTILEMKLHGKKL